MNKLFCAVTFLFISSSSSFLMAQPPELVELSEEFFTWRAVQQPCTSDDILRVERPIDWIPDWSTYGIEAYRTGYEDFRSRLDQMRPTRDWTRRDSIDYLLMHSAVERVNWELNVLQHPYRSPAFYVHQTLGSLFEILLLNGKMSDERIEQLIKRLDQIPYTLDHAIENLDNPFAGSAKMAISMLSNIEQDLSDLKKALLLVARTQYHEQLSMSIERSKEACLNYLTWLKEELEQMDQEFKVGKASYEYFLKNIALMPYSVEELLAMGEMEWARSVSFDSFEQVKNRSNAEEDMFESIDDQIIIQNEMEHEIRIFLEEKGILTVPDWVNDYRFVIKPDYLRALDFMGVNDDLTAPSRLDEDGVRYIDPPSEDFSFFAKSMAIDPRPITIHEGVPGHYFQRVRSWRNPDRIRQHYFDSGPIEGIGFYMEEVLLNFGLMDDSPQAREIIYQFMRLRALRVDVDVNLAIGSYSISQATDYLEKVVPIDRKTAEEEAGFFAINPGQAISYQIGKIQILQFLADARIKLGSEFDLRDFHDYLMINGNVPIALQRWEYLGMKDEIRELWPTR